MERSQLRQRASGPSPPFLNDVLEDVFALRESQDSLRTIVIDFGNKLSAAMQSSTLKRTN